MSYDVPPGQPEYLDSHDGKPLPKPRSRRTTLAAVGAGIALAAVGAGAWAAWSFFATGAQPAEALPASTIGYASIDLDPSGGQKIEALRTLRKFPAFKDEIGLDTDDDVRAWIFGKLQEDAGCDDLDFADDVEPWLGDRFAVAAVDTGADDPAPVFVLQVSDADAAETGLGKLRDCAGDEDAAAWSIDGGWALVGEDQKTVDAIAEDAADAPLSDDEDFQRWTDEAGDSGIVSLYAAPEVGAILAEELTSDDDLAELEGLDGIDEAVPDELTKALEEFEGAAATIRFDDGGLELEVAADSAATRNVSTGDEAGDVVASLPGSTVAALGLSLGDGWAQDYLDQMSSLGAPDGFLEEAAAELGIDLPEDAETLTGDAIALAVDDDFDAESLFSDPTQGSGPAGIGIKILGDADDIDGVLDKLRTAAAGADGGVLDSDTGDGVVAVGPDADYREQLLDDGDLGDSDAYQSVIEHGDGATGVLFVDFDGADSWLAELAGDDDEVRDNLEPLSALGMSSWSDDDVTHAVLQVTTD